MSHSAWSMPAMALMWIGAAAVEAAAVHRLPVILDVQRVLADEVVGKLVDRGLDRGGRALRRPARPSR